MLDVKQNVELNARSNDALDVVLTKESLKYVLRVFYYYDSHNCGWRTICGFDSLPTWDEMKNAGLVKELDDVRRQYIIVETKTKKSVLRHPKEGQCKTKRRKTHIEGNNVLKVGAFARSVYAVLFDVRHASGFYPVYPHIPTRGELTTGRSISSPHLCLRPHLSQSHPLPS